MLTLYYKLACGYCRKVLDFATAHNINLELRDIALEPATAAELITEGGKRQVPYLVDVERGVSMYESEDIVEYLKTYYVH